MKKITFIFIFLFCLSLDAQVIPKSGETADKIIAVVGDEAILKSDIEGQLFYLAQMDKNINPNDKSLQLTVLNGLIDQLILVQKAIKDSVNVSDEEVNQRLEIYIQNEIRRFGSEKRMEQIYNMSLPRIRNEAREKIRQNILVQTLVAQKLADVKVTQREIEEFYNLYKDSLPVIPKSIELYHIVKKVTTELATKKDIYNFALKIRDSIIAGGDFADFAKRYSQDQATAKDGGDLGWFQRGKLIPEYEQAALKLTAGEISQPIETPFGFHLIQTLEKKSDGVRTRHILFKFEKTGNEEKQTIEFLEELRRKVKNGESFDSLAIIYSDDKETRNFGGYLGKIPVSELPQNIASAILNLNDGETTEPMIYKSEGNNKTYNIIYKKRTIPEHVPKLPDDIKEIENFATEYKKKKIYETWLKELRKEIYWEILDKSFN